MLEDNDNTFLSLVSLYQKVSTLTNLYVDYYGTFVSSSDPASLFVHGNYLNSTRSSSLLYLIQMCPDPKSNLTGIDVIIGKERTMRLICL